MRSRFFDEFFAGVLGGPAATRLRQVVLLAAGLDTRAFRLDWPADVTLYEVDAPLVLGFKDHVLASRPARIIQRKNNVWHHGQVTAGRVGLDWPVLLHVAACVG